METIQRRSFIRRLMYTLLSFFFPGVVMKSIADGNAIGTGSEKGEQSMEKIIKTEKEWKEVLTPEQFEVTRRKGTERAFSGKYHDHKADGVYRCVCCHLDLFDSKAKFDSGTGWPSFFKPVASGHIREEKDFSFFMKRTEVLCRRCDAHLGHVFPDGPKPTGLRYCINSVSLEFVNREEAQ